MAFFIRGVPKLNVWETESPVAEDMPGDCLKGFVPRGQTLSIWHVPTSDYENDKIFQAVIVELGGRRDNLQPVEGVIVDESPVLSCFSLSQKDENPLTESGGGRHYNVVGLTGRMTLDLCERFFAHDSSVRIRVNDLLVAKYIYTAVDEGFLDSSKLKPKLFSKVEEKAKQQ